LLGGGGDGGEGVRKGVVKGEMTRKGLEKCDNDVS